MYLANLEGRAMSLIARIREISARRAEDRKIRAEAESITDAELNDLGLSWAEFSELSLKA